MYSPSESSSRSSSRSNSFSEFTRPDEPCHGAFQRGDIVWVISDSRWQLGIVVSGVSIRPLTPYQPPVHSWEVAVLSQTRAAPAAGSGLLTSVFSPALGHMKPANNAMLDLLHAEGHIPPTSICSYNAPELVWQMQELRKWACIPGPGY